MGMALEPQVYAGSASRRFAEKVCEYLGARLGESEVITFPEGNTFVRLCQTVRDKEVYIIQTVGVNPNDDFMEMLFWIDALRRASASTVTAVMPYFSYSKADKKDEPHVSIRARVCADCLEVTGADRIVTMDLHSPQVQGFFKIPVDNLYAQPVLCAYIKSIGIDNLVTVSPDVGFAKSARKYAAVLGTTVAIGDKVRSSHDSNALVLDLIGDVQGRNALIVDDFTVTCGTLADTARILRERGALRILACVSHAALRGPGLERLGESPIQQLVITDTVENPLARAQPKVKVISVAPLFAEAIMRIHNRQSVSQLFDSVPASVVEECLRASLP